MQYIRTRALIARGLTRDAFLAACEEYILVLSPARQDQARAYFHGRTKPGEKLSISFCVAGRA